ncbi:MAG: flagellar biosynthetic protein FliO [Armatimonadota bacterium]
MPARKLPKTSKACVLVGFLLVFAQLLGLAGVAAATNSQESSVPGGSASVGHPNRSSDNSVAFYELSGDDKGKKVESLAGISVARVCISLLLVLGMAYLTIIALRKYTDVRPGMTGVQRRIRVVENLSLGPGRSVHLVEIGSRKLLIGSTATSVTMLAELDAQDVSNDASLASSSKEQRSGGTFAEHVKFFLGDMTRPTEVSCRVAHLLRETSSYLREKLINLDAMRRRAHGG